MIGHFSLAFFIALCCLLHDGGVVGDGDFLHEEDHSSAREGRQIGDSISSGIDFSDCITDLDSGLCCIDKDERISSIRKDPLLECTHTNIENCHYSYVTQFSPSQEEVCDEIFEKICQITFRLQAFNETVQKCYTPLTKVCSGQGPEECRTLYETACSTKYVEKQPGKFVGDTSCEKIPIEICGAGCSSVEGPQECHDKIITSTVDIPEEVCDLNPQKTCRFETKLVPRLRPAHECTTIPRETCQLKFSAPTKVEGVLKTKWCLDDTPPPPGETYEDNNAIGEPLQFLDQEDFSSF